MTLESTVKKYRALFASKLPVLPAHEPKGHFYVSPATQEKYHSVTYFTSFIKDPSLANWKLNRGLDHIANQIKYDPNRNPSYWLEIENIAKLVDQAKLAPEETFNTAGDIGSQTHAWRQEWFAAWIDEGVISLTDEQIDQHQLPPNADPEVISGCRAIKRFLKETGAIPVACELPLVDDELKVGGTIDDLMVFPNKQKIYYTTSSKLPSDLKIEPGTIILLDPFEGGFKTYYKPYLGFVDLKTSNQGKKPAYAYQVRGFYQRMIRKTFGIKPKKTYILHTSKDDGTYKLIDLTEMKHLEKDAQDLVRLSRSWDQVQVAFKPKQVII